MAKSNKGFASLSPEERRARASAGGRAAHAKGTAHEWSSEEAREAGRKGGIASWAKHPAKKAQDRIAGDQRARATGLIPADEHEVSRFADGGNPHHE